MNQLQVKVCNRLVYEMGLPHYATEGSAGLDLRACIQEQIMLRPGETKMIPTGIAIYIGDPGYAAQILPRSGLGAKQGLVLGNLVGLIDSDYQGELMIAAWNRNHLEPVWIEPGMRLAQLIVIPVHRPVLTFVHEFSQETTRGAGGWGSTGKT